MRAVLVTFVIMAGLVWAVVHFSGLTGFDPAEAAAEFRAQATPGTSWATLVDLKEPREVGVGKIDHAGIYRVIRWGFNRDEVSQAVQAGSWPDGFELSYRFSESEAFAVVFDRGGKVVAIQDDLTMGDLLQGNLYTQ